MIHHSNIVIPTGTYTQRMDSPQKLVQLKNQSCRPLPSAFLSTVRDIGTSCSDDGEAKVPSAERSKNINADNATRLLLMAGLELIAVCFLFIYSLELEGFGQSRDNNDAWSGVLVGNERMLQQQKNEDAER